MAKNILQSNFIPDVDPDFKPTQQSQNGTAPWPTHFPKPVIGIERKNVITQGGSLNIIEGALEAIRNIRLKGYKLLLISDERGGIPDQIDAQNHQLMNIFGEAGIQSIDGVYYSISAEKTDFFVKPATGMFKRAEQEHQGVKFSSGRYVGYNINDMKAAFKIGAKGILINPNEEELKKLNSFANQKVKKKTQVFDSLQAFERTLN